jgi:hypothetical protein
VVKKPRPYFPVRPDVTDIDPREVEERMRNKLAGEVLNLHESRNTATGEVTLVPFARGVTFTDVRLEGSFPHTEVVAFLEIEGHEGVRFGARRRVWEDDGALSGIIDVFYANLLEDLDNRRDDRIRELEPGESGIVWLYL